MSRDYYAEAMGIAQRLDDEGLADKARALREAIETGSTGTEILMALRWNLQRIDSENLGVGMSTRERIRELGAAIGVALDG